MRAKYWSIVSVTYITHGCLGMADFLLLENDLRMVVFMFLDEALVMAELLLPDVVGLEMSNGFQNVDSVGVVYTGMWDGLVLGQFSV